MGRRRRRRAEQGGFINEVGDGLAQMAASGPLGMAVAGAFFTVSGIWAKTSTGTPTADLMHTLGGLIVTLGVTFLIGAALWALVRHVRNVRPSTPGASRALAPAPPAPPPSSPPANPRDGRAFERVVADLYRAMGYAVQETGRHGTGTDGGADLVCTVPPAALGAGHVPAHLTADVGAELLVQCKDYAKGYVSVDQMRAFYGAVCGWPTRPTRGAFVTTRWFSDDARAFAKLNSIQLIDGPSLAKRLAALRLPVPPGTTTATAPPSPTPPPSGRPATFATPPAPTSSSARVRPVAWCPRCNLEMVLRRPKPGKKIFTPFYGCANYPKCQQRMNLT